MSNQEILHKEIDLIQAIINRMANNSFLLKGWIISLIAVILALTKDTALELNQGFLLLLIFPVLIFWYLDAFFLHKESCYRKLYEFVIKDVDHFKECPYNLDYTRFEKQEPNILQIMFTKTLLAFYGSIIILINILFFYQLLR